MAKLYFRYGTMGSAKSLNLLAVAHNYREQGKTILLGKPITDTRQLDRQQGASIGSRAGLCAPVDLIIEPNTDLPQDQLQGLDCILIDEAQFLSAPNVQMLRNIASLSNIPVICYGLRTNFRGKLFEGAQRLFELADTIEEIKTTCHKCNKKAIMNLRQIDGRPTTTGPDIFIGAQEYVQVCYRCFYHSFDAHSQAQEPVPTTSSTHTLAQQCI